MMGMEKTSKYEINSNSIQAKYLYVLIFRFGFADNSDNYKDPEDEVNDYLMRAIDARSIDHLRTEHCQSMFLIFKDSKVEKKV